MKRPDAPNRYWVWVDRCRKRGFYERAAAARAASLARRDGDHMRPYRCAECRMWHIGHLPKPVRRGQVAAADVYRGAR